MTAIPLPRTIPAAGRARVVEQEPYRGTHRMRRARKPGHPWRDTAFAIVITVATGGRPRRTSS